MSSLMTLPAVVDEPVVAVAGVRIERDVGEHADLRHGVLDRLDRAADEIVRCSAPPRASSVRRSSGVLGNSAMQGMPRSAALPRLAGDAGRRSSG